MRRAASPAWKPRFSSCIKLVNSRTTSFSIADLNPGDRSLQPGPPSPDTLSVSAWENWYSKHEYALCRQFLDMMAATHPQDSAGQRIVSLAQERLPRDLSEDAVFWQGWWGRHDNTLDYLGDDVAGPSGEGGGVPQAILIVLFLALMGTLVREMRPRPPRRILRRPPARRSRR